LNVLGIVASPRKGSNTDILVDHILQGVTEAGHNGNKIYLYEYTIGPCVDCRRCKSGRLVCTLKDGMQSLYPEIDRADVLVFGTPVYFYGPTGQMKLFIDRLRPYVANGRFKGKRAVVVAPSGEGRKAASALVTMLRLSLEYLGAQYGGALFPAVYERSAIRENQRALAQARRLGIKQISLS